MSAGLKIEGKMQSSLKIHHHIPRCCLLNTYTKPMLRRMLLCHHAVQCLLLSLDKALLCPHLTVSLDSDLVVALECRDGVIGNLGPNLTH